MIVTDAVLNTGGGLFDVIIVLASRTLLASLCYPARYESCGLGGALVGELTRSRPPCRGLPRAPEVEAASPRPLWRRRELGNGRHPPAVDRRRLRRMGAL